MNKPLTPYDSSSGLRAVVTLAAIVAVVLLGVIGVHALQPPDPYIKAVLALPGDMERGQAMFQMNCSGCHGITADGRVGPSLHRVSERKSKPALIKQVTSGQTPPMPQFQPSPEDMADLLKYLESL